MRAIDTDCISRQAAIDDIWTVSPLARLDRKWIDRWLRQLPSAQPTFDARDTQYNLPIGTDLISRAQAIDALDKCHCGGKDENGRPWIYKENAVEAIEMVEPLPPAEPKRGKWILDRSGAYCCSKCMEPCAGYVMMKPRDKFCKMCGSRNEVTE